HVYPVGIQDRADWPLNTVPNRFVIEERDITQQWYRKQFEELVDPLQIDLGNMHNTAFARCLTPRGFKEVTLRKILIELAKTCRFCWVFEPLPPEELNARIRGWGDG